MNKQEAEWEVLDDLKKSRNFYLPHFNKGTHYECTMLEVTPKGVNLMVNVVRKSYTRNFLGTLTQDCWISREAYDILFEKNSVVSIKMK